MSPAKAVPERRTWRPQLLNMMVQRAHTAGILAVQAACEKVNGYLVSYNDYIGELDSSLR
jgi:hypothetical protein